MSQKIINIQSKTEKQPKIRQQKTTRQRLPPFYNISIQLNKNNNQRKVNPR